MDIRYFRLWTRVLQRGLLLPLWWACGFAHATSPCVDTSDELQTALNNAHSQIDPLYVIRIVASPTPYQLGPGNEFVYVPPNTSISGGYSAGCGSRTDDADSTIIDLGGYHIGFLQADISVANHLEFDDLTFRHGSDFYAIAGSEHNISDEIGDIVIQNARFTDFVSGPSSSPPVGLAAVKGLVQLVNVQFDHLHQNSNDNCAVTIYGDNDSSFTANFVTADLTNGKDFCLAASDQSGSLTARIDNSIVWGSDNASPDVAAIRGADPSGHGHPINLSTHNSLYHYFAGWGNVTPEDSHVSADPHWVNPAVGDYRLADVSSPAVNTGTANGALGVPYYDINRILRTIGSHPDRGAHESPFDDSPVLVVSSAADDGPQTLRAAITNANLFGGAHTITFDLGACPTVIQLVTPLPYITSTVTVDGYTQPGSTPNDSDEMFDASLCVLIKPATSAAVAFHVPTNANGGANATLTLFGLGIGGFGQGVSLLGGTNHSIRGNQFGGIANGVDLGGASLNNITVGVDADSFAIGSFGPANRNLIGGASGGLGNGINVQSGVASDPDHCQIVNNWVGLAADGVTALPNEFGIQLSGSGCAVVDNRIAGNTLAEVWINAGHDNIVQHNIIGYNVWANSLPNDGVGIRIDGDNNTIGGSAISNAPGSLLANYIGKMAEGGIAVTSGVGNSIRGNFITENGPNHDGAGMDIDLGGDGPTANGSHAPPGPDNWQAFPSIDSVAYVDYPPVGNPDIPATISGHLDGAPGAYRVDAYYSLYCSAVTGRGHAENYLGDTVVTIPAGASSATFSFWVVLPSDIHFISLAATSPVNGTSELGTCFAISSGVNDGLFRSGFGTGADY